MYSKWIKSGFILAILLVSMVSLSMAACPWLIKNELYTAQCGVIKVVPASAGILANDPGAVAVLNPESITIDAKYGTLDVNADGSFVYDPSPDMQSGTYVTFKYGATNGACAATVMGTAKIQVSCKCRPQLANITLCLPTTLADIKAALEEEGADCLGCGATATIFDLSKIVLAPGRYPYLLKCPGCQAVVGYVTLIPGCTAVAPDMSFCGPVTLTEVMSEINAKADCTGAGCDQSPLISPDLTVVNGFVTGGSYSATCGAGTVCSDNDTGIITVFQKCDVAAPPIEICEGKNLTELLEEINAVANCGEDCDATPVVNTDNVTVVGGLVTGGSYKVTCTVAPNCESSATGIITVVPKCEVELIGVSVRCVTPEQIEATIKAENPTPCGDCDIAPTFDFPVWPLRTDGSGFVQNGIYQYEVTCNAGGLDDCDSSGTGEVIIDCTPVCPCVAEALPIEICPGKVTKDALKAMILDGNATCSDDGSGIGCDITPAIVLNVGVDANGFVTGGTYTATCQTNPGCLAVVATSTVTVVDRPECHPCSCGAVAPDICLPIICFGHNCHTYTYGEILAEVIAKGGKCTTGCTMALEIPDIKWNFPGAYTYKVICTKAGCTEGEATGKLTVTWKCPDCKTCCTTC
jgi:hypothetical protein